MPAQLFSINQSEAPVARLSWETGPVDIDLTYDGTLLTRITDAAQLRTTGMQGQAPDGSSLVLRLATGANGDQFTLERDGALMYAHPVDFASTRSYAAPVVVPAASSAHEKAMVSGRRWLTGLGVLSVIGGLAIVAIAGTDNLKIDVDRGTLRATGAIVLVVGVLYLLLGRFAKGARAKTMFGVGAVITGLNFAANVVNLARSGSAPGGGIIPIVVSGIAFQRLLMAYRAAKASAG